MLSVESEFYVAKKSTDFSGQHNFFYSFMLC